jgi:hypothetical protein
MSLSPRQVDQTLDTIVAAQQRDGCIPWFAGGHADPWDHVESAMALLHGGRRVEAERAYEWVRSSQRPDGALAFYYLDGRVEDPKLDANHSTYVAVGVWHHFVVTGDTGFLAEMWPVVEGAIEFALSLQAPGGEVTWMRMPPEHDGSSGGYALLTSSSCVHLSLRCAIAVAERLGYERPDWELSLGSLAHAIAHREHEAFEPKDRFSMDWYYPVLGGVLAGDTARARLLDADRWSTFVVPGRGVRCVADQPWVTAAETCEAVMSMATVGLRDEAESLFEWVQYLRSEDGSYWTGHNYEFGEHYPENERTTWTGAAAVLADDVLRGGVFASMLRGDGLPVGVVEVEESVAD